MLGAVWDDLDGMDTVQIVDFVPSNIYCRVLSCLRTSLLPSPLCRPGASSKYSNDEPQAPAGNSTTTGDAVPSNSDLSLFHPPPYRCLCWYIGGEIVSAPAPPRAVVSCCLWRSEAFSRRRRYQIVTPRPPRTRAPRGTPIPMPIFVSSGSPADGGRDVWFTVVDRLVDDVAAVVVTGTVVLVMSAVDGAVDELVTAAALLL
jgi:hypothetical protein